MSDGTSADSSVITVAPPTGLDAWIESHRVTEVRASLDDLTGLERGRRAVAALGHAILCPDELIAAGGTLPRAVLICGPVGCGKTSLARCLAGLVGEQATYLEFVAAELTPERVAAIVRYTETSTVPVIVFIDELSWAGVDRSSPLHDPESRASLFALLAAVSGLRDPAVVPVLWVGATSDDPDSLDEALTRPGRFGRIIEVRRPNARQRREHLTRLLGARRTIGPIDLDHIVALTAGGDVSYAALDQLVDDGLSLALADRLSGVDEAHLLEALAAGGVTDEQPELPPGVRWRTCIHEAGHGLIGHVLAPGSVRAISVGNHRRPRTTIGPVRPLLDRSPETEEDELIVRPLTEAELHIRIRSLLAGSAAERLFFPNDGASMGGSDDARRVGELLVHGWFGTGMEQSWPALWPAWPEAGPGFADKRANSVGALLDRLAADVHGMLLAHRPGIERLARRLMVEDELTGRPLLEALDDAIAPEASL